MNTLQTTEVVSRKIKNISLLCAALVVCIHATFPGDLNTSSWLFEQLIGEGVAKAAVPFFFIISGFFLSAHFEEPNWWGREVSKRVSSLVIPFFLWLFIYAATSFLLIIVADFQSHRPFGTNFNALTSQGWLRILGLDFLSCPTLLPLWYVRCFLSSS